jgi:hypothetical protein
MLTKSSHFTDGSLFPRFPVPSGTRLNLLYLNRDGVGTPLKYW